MTKTTKEPKYVAATLAWCNARRKEKGKSPLKRLPKGERHDGASCPCGKATGLYVGVVNYNSAADFSSEHHLLPKTVQRFVKAFDGGRLPQYDAAAAAQFRRKNG